MLKYSTYTDVGARSVNEDSFGVSSCGPNMVFAVCDGLGGHSNGDLASRTAVEAIQSTLTNRSDVVDFVSAAIQKAQTNIKNTQIEIPSAKKMRTTAVVLFSNGEYFQYGHVGDSRLYAFSNNGEYIRTIDHSVPQILALTGEIEEKEIRFHPDRNLVLKALGNEGNSSNAELSTIRDLADYYAFLLCTDGFWEHISEEEMMSTLSSASSAEQWMELMVKVIKQNVNGKNADNRTAIAIINC